VVAVEYLGSVFAVVLCLLMSYKGVQVL